MRLLLACAAVAALSLPAAAEWRKMDGEPAPAIEAEKWFNTGRKGPTAADLRGKVILLEFFATW